jgi:hypothetical protein
MPVFILQPAKQMLYIKILYIKTKKIQGKNFSCGGLTLKMTYKPYSRSHAVCAPVPQCRFSDYAVYRKGRWALS